MGLGTTWIASRGLGADRMLDALGLVATGEFEGAYVADAAIAEIPGGWCVVHFGRFDPRPEWVARSFPNGEVIWGASSETVMWSGAYGLSDGRLVWSAEHDPEKDREGVSTSGALPDAFGEVMDGLQRQQEGDGEEDVDHLFEVPMALTAALCGYDPTRQAAGVPFRVVEPLRSGAAGERQAARIALTRALATSFRLG